jgi:hypothetical protein
MLEWQLVHDCPCAEWLCAGTAGWPVVEFSDGEWHCRQIVFTLA